MKYTDRTSKTVYEEVEIEIPDGDNYFHTWDNDEEPKYYYKIHVKEDERLKTLYNIAMTKVCNYDDSFFVTWKEISDNELPFGLRRYFSGEEKIEKITEEEFNKIKTEVLNKLKQQ